MDRGSINKISLAISSGTVLIALIGATLLTPTARAWLEENAGVSLPSIASSKEEEEYSADNTAVLQLVSLDAKQREAQLLELTKSPNKQARSRARYLLASDYIDRFEGGEALRKLRNLEEIYPVLAPTIALKRGRAYELTNNNEKAIETWQKLLETYPDSPVAAEALYMLSKSDPTYADRAIERFPNHPLSQEIIRQRLKENPEQLKLMLLLAKYAADDGDVNMIRDRLVEKYSSELSSEDWEAIASGYWDRGEYGKAAKIYYKTPRTPRNLYRIARGMHLSAEKEQAKKMYQMLVNAYPDASETALALKHLASLSKPQEAIGYLDRTIRTFADAAPEALLTKANLLDSLNSKKAAAQARQSVLVNYATSDAAASYRWQKVQKLAAEGKLVEAWKWAQPITTNNINSDLAPKAAFWIGKWARRLNRPDDAKAAFEYVLANHPQSYYAWRSAVGLGWKVGDFKNVRYIQPEVVKAPNRPVPPGGSDSFKELYLLGQNRDAWNLFEAEIVNRADMSVAQQFIEGLMLLEQGRYIEGINRIVSLRERKDPTDRAQWQQLRQTPEYWYALFPFPFEETILNWSNQRQINSLLVTSLIRQESRFEAKIASPAGALGLMQVMPATGDWIAKQTGLEKYSLTNPEDNVKLGTWYLDYTHKEYKNNALLAVASYNAGPGNVANWIKKYGLRDPDTFIENIPFRETKGYVEAVFGNYWNYLRLYNPKVSQQLSQYQAR